MKQKLIIVFGLILFVLHVNSQEFAPVGAKWYYSHFDGATSELTYMESVGEQVVNNKLCKILKTFQVDERWTPDSIYYCTSGISTDYLYRENQKLYHYDSFKGGFEVLYDFSLLAGENVIVRDTSFEDCLYFPPWGYYCSSFKYIIDSIDDVLVGDSLLTRQYTSTILDANWGFNIWTDIYPSIENIGSTRYFFGQDTQGLPVEGSLSFLRCYEDSNMFYRTEYWPADKPCNYLSPIIYANNSEKSLGSKVNISPNPCSGLCKIEFPENAIIEKYIITDIRGNTIKTIKPTYGNRIINISELVNGIYFIKINISNTLVVKKIIKK